MAVETRAVGGFPRGNVSAIGHELLGGRLRDRLPVVWDTGHGDTGATSPEAE